MHVIIAIHILKLNTPFYNIIVGKAEGNNIFLSAITMILYKANVIFTLLCTSCAISNPIGQNQHRILHNNIINNSLF